MKFQKGDKVKFLNDDDYGTVIRVAGQGIVVVLNRDDFEVPVQESELILDPSSRNKNNSQETRTSISNNIQEAKPVVKVESKKQTSYKPINHDGEIDVYLGFVPSEGKPADKCDLDVYLINDSDCNICYNLIVPEVDTPYYNSFTGILEADTKEFVVTINRSKISNLSQVKYQLLFSLPHDTKIIKPSDGEIKLQSVKFFQSNYYRVNEYFDENAVIIPIFKTTQIEKFDVGETVEKEKKRTLIIKKKKKHSELEVVDLHITEILDDERGMKPQELLEYQLKYFKDKLNEFIADHNVKKAIFIHGKGNGTLKMEVRKCLEREYKKYNFQDASFEEYGGGATLVYVK